MLSKHFVQKIVNQIMEDIDYNLNIMDETGMIIASGDAKRIGMIHQGAKKVLMNKERNFIYKDTLTEKKGINDPIFIGDVCVGVVGISGDPKEVLKIKNVVNTLFYFLISREQEIGEKFSKKEMREKIIRKLIYHHGELSYEERKFLKKESILLLEGIVVVVVSGLLRYETNHQLIYINSNNLYIYLATNKDIQLACGLEKLLDKLFKPNYICGVSTSEKINEGYHQALETLHFVQLFKQKKSINYYQNNRLFVNTLVSKNPFTSNKKLDEKIILLKKDDVLFDTLLAFIENNAQMKNTSEQLIIHRNTLHYRLKKIKKLTCLDPYTFKGLVNLVDGILTIEKNNKKYHED